MLSPLSNKTAPTLYLEGDIRFDSDRPVKTSGGFGDLFSGTHQDDGKVALKRLRIPTDDDPRVRSTAFLWGSSDAVYLPQRCLNETLAEARIWRGLVHDHVLPFLGVLFHKEEIYLVSPFIVPGSLRQFCLLHPSADRGKLVCYIPCPVSSLLTSGIWRS